MCIGRFDNYGRVDFVDIRFAKGFYFNNKRLYETYYRRCRFFPLDGELNVVKARRVSLIRS